MPFAEVGGDWWGEVLSVTSVFQFGAFQMQPFPAAVLRPLGKPGPGLRCQLPPAHCLLLHSTDWSALTLLPEFFVLLKLGFVPTRHLEPTF